MPSDISPGWVDTPMFDEIVGDAKYGYFEELAARLPSGRIAKPRGRRARLHLPDGERLHDRRDGAHRRRPPADLAKLARSRCKGCADRPASADVDDLLARQPDVRQQASSRFATLAKRGRRCQCSGAVNRSNVLARA